jgi:hypothetical protein
MLQAVLRLILRRNNTFARKLGKGVRRKLYPFALRYAIWPLLMSGITAILHTHNDELRIARAIESLRPCDEVLVIDHSSSDDTCLVARQFGARVIAAPATETMKNSYPKEAQNDWIFCLLPTEAVSEGLEASLWEWKLTAPAAETAFSVSISEEALGGWVQHPAEARLAHRQHARWDGWKPLTEGVPRVLDGYLTRLHLP